MALGAWMRSLTPVGKPKSEVEAMVEEALSKGKWQTRGSLLHNLAAKTLKDENAKNIILPPVWKILDATNTKEWHRVVKALAVVETCLKRASLPTIEDIRQNTAKVARWQNCSIIEDEKDVAGVMREKVNLILAMCQDVQLLKEERRKYIEITQKLAKKGAGEAPQQEGQQRPEGEMMASVVSNNLEVASLGTRSTRTSEAAAAPSLQDDRSTSSGQSVAKPDYQDLRQRCAMVQKATGVTAFQAMRFLKETDWDVNKAVQAAGGQGKTASNPQSGERSASEDESDGDSPPSSSSARRKNQQSPTLEGRGRKGEWSNMAPDWAGTASWPTSTKPPWLSEGGKGGASSASTASPKAAPTSSFSSARSPAGGAASFGSGVWSSSGTVSEQLGKGAFSPHGSSIASGSLHSGKGAMALGCVGSEQLGKGGSPTAWSPHSSHALSSPHSAKGSSPMSKGSEQQWAKEQQRAKGGDQQFGKGSNEQPFGKGSMQQAWTPSNASSAPPFSGKGWSPMGKGNEQQQLGKGGCAAAWSPNAAAQPQSSHSSAAKGGYPAAAGKGGKQQGGRGGGAAFP